MKIYFGQEGTTEEFINGLEIMEKEENIKSIMVLASDNNTYDIDALNRRIVKMKESIFGGVFTGLLYEGAKYDKGILMIGLPMEVKTLLLENIGEVDRDLDDELENFKGQLGKEGVIAVFVDALSSGVELLKQSLFDNWGLSNNYIGGGAGSISFQRTPCIIANDGFSGDRAIVAKIDLPNGIGVAHGWTPISEVLKVTEADRNKIISLNWEPAYYVYKRTVEKISGSPLDVKDFFHIATGYPFGISKMAKEMVVRDPIAVEEDKFIICVGEVPKNSFVYILKGENEALIQGAKQAKSLAYDSFNLSYGRKPKEDSVILFIDCISRALFLGDEFIKELDVVGNERMIGALTLGEIANSGKSYLEFYNKTSVIGILEG